MGQVLAISHGEVGIDTVGEPAARTPIHDALDAIRVGLEGLWIGKPVGIKDVSGGRIDNPRTGGKPGKASGVAPVVGSILEKEVIREIASG